ncbi:MAG: dockerin type I domain-containing protein, partial [Sedimentisphaerales bacterium]|nr:dockerin type I domain-containing protein [Sedimentisphaerales bacterium]
SRYEPSLGWDFLIGPESGSIWEIVMCRVDLDLDGAVNFTDYAIFANHWMDETCCDPNWCEGTDFDKSGSVDMLDLATFARYWLEGI